MNNVCMDVIAVVHNCPIDDLDEDYIVARLVGNSFWYYGNYSCNEAHNVAKQLGDNAVVFKI